MIELTEPESFHVLGLKLSKWAKKKGVKTKTLYAIFILLSVVALAYVLITAAERRREHDFSIVSHENRSRAHWMLRLTILSSCCANLAHIWFAVVRTRTAEAGRGRIELIRSIVIAVSLICVRGALIYGCYGFCKTIIESTALTIRQDISLEILRHNPERLLLVLASRFLATVINNGGSIGIRQLPQSTANEAMQISVIQTSPA